MFSLIEIANPRIEYGVTMTKWVRMTPRRSGRFLRYNARSPTPPQESSCYEIWAVHIALMA